MQQCHESAIPSLNSRPALQALVNSGYLTVPDLLHLSQVCRDARDISNENDGTAWKISYRTTFHEANFSGASGESVKRACLRRFFKFEETAQYKRSCVTLQQALALFQSASALANTKMVEEAAKLLESASKHVAQRAWCVSRKLTLQSDISKLSLHEDLDLRQISVHTKQGRTIHFVPEEADSVTEKCFKFYVFDPQQPLREPQQYYVASDNNRQTQFISLYEVRQSYGQRELLLHAFMDTDEYPDGQYKRSGILQFLGSILGIDYASSMGQEDDEELMLAVWDILEALFGPSQMELEHFATFAEQFKDVKKQDKI